MATHDDITRLFSYYAPYESQEFLCHWLKQQYEKHPDFYQQAATQSYNNTPVFHYEWMIGRSYWKEGLRAPLMIKPLLLFYGMTHLLKGIILLEDPVYPASAEMLAHGVTTRKRKRKGYTFLEDEIKIQKKGFFPHFSNVLFHVEHAAGEKWKMKELLMKEDSLLALFQKIIETDNFPSLANELPAVCTHYLLLYNLSMISRYEGEWWGELLSQQQSLDYPFIKSYLEAAGTTIPKLFQPYF
ncbi:YaaC family protein [Bacillus piscicola]|uniref:YaaC family protein n=1 Tax=Bacillus piscicola TaxID=1632684 RepID=UPI001F09716B|nr:YaaC family protein [Bacillus piscicola]